MWDKHLQNRVTALDGGRTASGGDWMESGTAGGRRVLSARVY